MEEREKIIETFSELSSRYEEVVDSELSQFWEWNYDSFIAYMLDNIFPVLFQLIKILHQLTTNVMSIREYHRRYRL